MSSDRPNLDARRVRQLFERAGKTPLQADFVAREVAARMADRLEYIKIEPLRALDAGSGRGDDLARLRKRFPHAQWHALDFALPRLQQSRATERASLGFFERLSRDLNLMNLKMARKAASPHWICADFANLPLAPRSFDLIWSNLALHWHDQPHQIFPEWASVLNVGGLVLFSAFGPDTLKEISNAFAVVQGNSLSTHPFTDMHDYGDMLVAAGFTTPVMDMERLTLTYSDPASLWRDVRALGGNALAQRRRGLLGRRAYLRLMQALESQRDGDGRYRLSFEIIYGHAWKGQPRTTADGQAIVRLDRLRGSRSGSPPSKP